MGGVGMGAFIPTSRFIFGAFPDKSGFPDLPLGWRYLDSKEDFLRAADAAGHTYLYAQQPPELWPERRYTLGQVIASQGKIKVGEFYADERYATELAALDDHVTSVHPDYKSYGREKSERLYIVLCLVLLVAIGLAAVYLLSL
jgi:hypothetical protein